MPLLFDWSKTIAEIPGKPIPDHWLATRGEGVKVAIIDTGANLGLPSLGHLSTGGQKFFTSAPGFSVDKLVGQDLVDEVLSLAGHGHGTLYTALLAGRDPLQVPHDRDLVTGLANGITCFIIKVTDLSGEITTIRHLLSALELSANLGVEIAITGQCISRSEMLAENLSDADIDRVFDLPGMKKMFLFAPLKNRKSAQGWANITAKNFPSHRPEVFNVAAMPDILPAVAPLIHAQNIPFLLSSFRGGVLSKNGHAISMGPQGSEVEFSNSGATAIMGGIAALALSFFKQQSGGVPPTRDEFRELLGTCCQPLSQALSPQATPGFFRNF